MSVTEIEDDVVVTIHFTLTDPSGQTLDRADADDPLVYLHGHENIVPGLEDALVGRQVGDAFQVVIAPEQGYGTKTGETERVPRDEMPEDIEIGMELLAEDDDGDAMPFWIVALEGDEVVLSPDHPLAGVTLHFDVQIMSMRAATKEELEHGHPHGPDGHAHH